MSTAQTVVLSDRYGYQLAPDWFPYPENSRQRQVAHRLSSLLGLLLGGATAVALGGMLAWHTYLVLTAQGTIEFYSNRLAAWEARKRGLTWVNIYDVGFVRNWQDRFDVKGRWWWLTWALPRLRAHSRNGYVHMVVRDHEHVLLDLRA